MLTSPDLEMHSYAGVLGRISFGCPFHEVMVEAPVEDANSPSYVGMYVYVYIGICIE